MNWLINLYSIWYDKSKLIYPAVETGQEWIIGFPLENAEGCQFLKNGVVIPSELFTMFLWLVRDFYMLIMGVKLASKNCLVHTKQK